MFESILEFNWIGIVIILITMYFVKQDGAFSRRIRIEFHNVGVLCAGIILLSNHLFKGDVRPTGTMHTVALVSGVVVCPLIVAILVHIFFSIRKTKTDIYFGIFMILMIIGTAVYEIVLGDMVRFTTILGIFVSVFYSYFAIQTYKKDGLTKLLLRHNLNFDMADMANKDYLISLIDVDNFKLINDKYGHDKGDEVLVTIANTIKSHLPKGCKLYRFGGDEFVVISRKSTIDELTTVFESINNELANNELRISVGIVEHKAGEDGGASLIAADKKMYENKKLLKSEDIWDDMTGLFNYRGFIDELDAFRKTVEKEGSHICLVAVDVDRLSNINMAYGYTEGNLAIKALSRIIKQSLKGRDFIGHLGSDEFAVAIECNGDDDERIISFIDELSEGMSSAYEFANRDYSLKVNVARYFVGNNDKLSSEDLVNNVLYVKQSDKEDRRKTDLNGDDQDFNYEEEAMVMDILDNNKFKYAFQPIVSAKNGEIVAYESLMRSDTETMISPLKILKYAEHNKRLYDIERYTFFNVMAKASVNGFLPEGRRIFINSIPGYMLNELDYDLLKNKYASLFENMVTEITEQREVNDEALATLNARRDRDGFNLAIDDYGSGCSNTNSLLRYMPQVIKLDRLLITGIDRNAKKQFFVNSIISFARENDMMILAEGVETESELKTVIRLGVDLIQGFFTAKPSFEILDEISNDIKKIIVDENLKVSGNQRMVYTASTDCELSVVHLAMEDYSKINISAENVKLVGSQEYTADMVIRIKEGVDCRLTLSDVSLNSVDDEPCIDIGEGAHLRLNLEGNSKLNAKGIHVPEGSSLSVVGPGNIEIFAKGHECYAIGADSESGFGKIEFKNSGKIIATVDGERCVGIGGGIANENSDISINAGSFKINVAGIEAVGIGYYEGKKDIHIRDCHVVSDFRVNKGIVVGSFGGNIDLDIKNFNFEIEGSGTAVCGIGSINDGAGKIYLNSGTYKIKLNGQKLYLLGCNKGELDINISHVKVDMMGEGDNVLGFGTHDIKSHMVADSSTLQLVINASSPLGFGIQEETVGFMGHLTSVRINGEDAPIGRAV